MSSQRITICPSIQPRNGGRLSCKMIEKMFITKRSFTFCNCQKVANKSFEIAAKFTFLETTPTNSQLLSGRNEEQTKFKECVLPQCLESFVFPSSI
jgi:hypothetical protein